MHETTLVVEPDDGTAPILHAIQHAKKTIDLTIFRFDRHDVTRALDAAIARGVQVRTLIAFSNRGGADSLRDLELRMLGAGATVARSSDTFARYHAKLMIVDSRVLHVNGFNFTEADLKSRSFGIITTNKQLVRQAIRLFGADLARRPYEGGVEGLVVSPENARERLETFIRGAHHELLIYDSRLGDPRMLHLLAERLRAGVAVRIIGHVGKSIGRSSQLTRHLDAHVAKHLEDRAYRPAIADSKRARGQVFRLMEEGVKAGLRGIRGADQRADLHVEKLHHRRLHLRAIVRDGTVAFIGSQSLRRAELDLRRELGVFVHDPDIVRRIRETFERDWPSETPGAVQPGDP